MPKQVQYFSEWNVCSLFPLLTFSSDNNCKIFLFRWTDKDFKKTLFEEVNKNVDKNEVKEEKDKRKKENKEVTKQPSQQQGSQEGKSKKKKKKKN